MTGQRRQKSMLIMVQISGPVTWPSQILDNPIYPPEYSFDMLCSGSNKTYFQFKIMLSITKILIDSCLADKPRDFFSVFKSRYGRDEMAQKVIE